MTVCLVNECENGLVSSKAVNNKQVDEDKKATVLIVEDSPAELMRTALLIEKFGYHVVTASDGLCALEILSSVPVDCIVSDWQMPNMDGIALCKKLAEKVDFPPYFLILTGRTNRYELISAMDAGADDYLSKPISSEELRVRIQAGLRLRQLSTSLTQKNTALNIALERERSLYHTMQESLRIAAKLQRSALPDKYKIVNRVAIAHCFRPAQGVAGDSYGLIRLSATHVAFYLIDVSGIGISAAMRSYAIVKSLQERSRQYAINPEAGNMLCPISVAQTLNEEFAGDGESDSGFTLTYGIINVDSRDVSMIQAGHPHAYLVSPAKDIIKFKRGDVPIGVLEKMSVEEVSFKLEKGYKLILYSDGIFACRSPNGKAFNETMLLQLLSSISAAGIVRLQNTLEKVLDRLIGTNPLKDDLSFLVLEEVDDSE